MAPPNRLAGETSPYLRQHAGNPVDWYPWGEEAFARARAEDRPVLLSVGYSSCHWCHVMAHESFEDPTTAEVMNRGFVNVKVDREERPDVDAVYMQAVQAMTGTGGWPMTVFLAPDGRPFYGGTYFPKQDAHGRPGFVRVLDAIGAAWRERRGELLDAAGQLSDLLETQSRAPAAGTAVPDPAALLDRAAEAVLAEHDARFGGFGGAPKFPPGPTLDLLLRHHLRTGSEAALGAVTTTLDAMAAGGIHDQLGGGFHRYSVDAYWLVPHFEKMLYDQALLTDAYLHAHLVTGAPRYRSVVESTIGYVLGDLRHPDGGFFSAEDADTEGVEGATYLWTLDEVAATCGADADAVVRAFGITASGNFEDPHRGVRGNVLHLVAGPDAAEAIPDGARRALCEVRSRRPRPALDDKVLLAWNALFLRALAEAAAALERDDWMEAARTNASFLLEHLRRPDGRLLRSWQGGTAHHLAYADDHAALLGALCTLAEVDDLAWLPRATAVADALLDLFSDPSGPGFFTTGRDADTLLVRPRDLTDDATPAANSLAADALLRLEALTGERRYGEPARAYLDAVAPAAARHPRAFAFLLGAFERAALPGAEVALVGAPGDPAARALRREVTGRYLPASVWVAAGPDGGAGAGLAVPLLEGRGARGGRATAYVCEGSTCREPVTDPRALAEQLDAVAPRSRPPR